MKPKFINAKDLLKDIPKNDLHLHTDYSDGLDKIEKYIDSAVKIGLNEIAFTEHIDLKSNWFDSFATDVKKQRSKFKKKLKVYYGVESSVIDYQGNLNARPEVIKKSELVMGVVHRYPSEKGEKYSIEEIKLLGKKKAMQLELSAAMALLKNPRVDIFGHPGATFERFFGEFPLELYRKLIKEAKKYNKAVEINSEYKKNFEGFIKVCLEENPLVSLGSNAHSISDLGKIYYKLKCSIKNL